MYSHPQSLTLRAAAVAARRARAAGLRPGKIMHRSVSPSLAQASSLPAVTPYCASCRSRRYHSQPASHNRQRPDERTSTDEKGPPAKLLAEETTEPLAKGSVIGSIVPGGSHPGEEEPAIAYLQPSRSKPTRVVNPIQLPMTSSSSADNFFDTQLLLDPAASPTTPPEPVTFSHSLPHQANSPAAPTTDQFVNDPTQPRPGGKIITADYRAPTLAQTSEVRGASSTWDATLRRCTNPIQLRVTVSRIFAQATTPKPVDIIAALNACARLALLGSKGVAPIMDQVASLSSPHHKSPTGSSPGGSTLKSQQFQRQAFEIAQSIMQSLVDRRTIPSLHMYTAYIRVCAHAGQVDAAFAALDDLKRNGLVPDTEIYKGLVMASARQGDLHRALQTVESSVQNTRTVSKHAKWLKMALRMAVGVEAGKWLGIVISLATDVNEIAGQIIGIGFGTVFGLRLAIPVIMPLEKLGSAASANKAASQSSLMQPPIMGPERAAAAAAASGPVFPADAYQDVNNNAVFHSLDAHEVNEHMHNFLVGQLEQSGNVDAALQVLDEMRNKGITVTIHTYNALVSDLVQLGKPDLALATIKKMSTVQPNAITFLPVIHYYYDRRKFAATVRVYEDHVVPLGVQPDLILYTSVISAYGKMDNVDKAMQVYDLFLRQGFVPNQFVLNTLISILAKNGRYRQAEEVVLVTMAKHGVSPSVRSFSKLIDKAVTIDPATYSPPQSPDFQPPPIPTDPSSTDDTASRPPPIQVERAWYWYQRLVTSGIPYDLVPIEFLLLVFGINGYSYAAIHEYASAIRTNGYDQRHVTPESLLLPRDHKRAPTMHGYNRLAVAASRMPSMPIEAAVALVYEVHARKAWAYALPDPAAFAAGDSKDVQHLVKLVAHVRAQQHTSPVLSPLGGQPEGPFGVARRCTYMINCIAARAVTDASVSVDMKRLLVAINEDLIRHALPMIREPIPAEAKGAAAVDMRSSNRQGSAVPPAATATAAPMSLVDEVAGVPLGRAVDEFDDDDDDGIGIANTHAIFIPPPQPGKGHAVAPSALDLRDIKFKPALLYELKGLMSRTKELRVQIASAGGAPAVTAAPIRPKTEIGRHPHKQAQAHPVRRQMAGEYWTAVDRKTKLAPNARSATSSDGTSGGGTAAAVLMRSALSSSKDDGQETAQDIGRKPFINRKAVGNDRTGSDAKASGRRDKGLASQAKNVNDFWTRV